MFISCYAARNEPKKCARGVPLDSLRPARSEYRRRAGAQWSELKATPFGRSDPKGCVGVADTAWSFGDTVRRTAPMFNCIFLIRLRVLFKFIVCG